GQVARSLPPACARGVGGEDVASCPPLPPCQHGQSSPCDCGEKVRAEKVAKMKSNPPTGGMGHSDDIVVASPCIGRVNPIFPSWTLSGARFRLRWRRLPSRR